MFECGMKHLQIDLIIYIWKWKKKDISRNDETSLDGSEIALKMSSNFEPNEFNEINLLNCQNSCQ